MEVQVAVCGVILKEDKILLLKRADSDEFAKRGSWTFPAGRVNYCETPDDAVLREIKEETSLNVEILKPIKIWSKTRGAVWRISIDYLCKYVGGVTKLSTEHDDYVWASFKVLDRMAVDDWIKEDTFIAKQETTRKVDA